jgi:tetratricopeptide (TPR) repeat protein
VDPWAHRVNSYVIDRDGRRIDQRNAEDIFTALYNHQIPPGAAAVVHYGFRMPDWATKRVELEVALRYRKFDTTYMRAFQGSDFAGNDLPITTIASDRIVFPVAGASVEAQPRPDIPEWMRWNDYGIGLLRAGELRQAEAAFRQVEAAGQPHGPLNLARGYLREGRLDEAAAALARAARFDPPAYPWSVAYFTAVLNRQNGFLDEAIEGFTEVLETRFEDARQRGFDFSRDYRLLNELAATLFERSRLERGEARREARSVYLTRAAELYGRALALDPENAVAHWGLSQVLAEQGDEAGANRHRRLHAVYKVDDNAGDRAVALARRADPAADHAAEDVVIYDLQRAGAWGLEPPIPATASR